MEETRVEILSSYSLTARKGKIVIAKLLSGNIKEDVKPMQMISEIAEDVWRVSFMVMFPTPYIPEHWEQQWERGERNLWFVPLGDLREILDGETFALVPKDSSHCIGN